MNRLGVKEIEQILPHRHPFLLVDYIEDYEPGKFAIGYKWEYDYEQIRCKRN